MCVEMAPTPKIRPRRTRYTPAVYDWMTGDAPRVGPYARAIARAVAGKSVLDIGTGRDALLALLCVRAGAKDVVAVEISPLAAVQAREAVSRAGFSDRVRVVTGHSAMVALPRVDIVVHEIVGHISTEEGAAAVVKDLQERPDVVDSAAPGWLLPRRFETRILPLQLAVPDDAGNSMKGGGRTLSLPEWFFKKAVVLGCLQACDCVDGRAPVQLQQRHSLSWSIAGAAMLTGFACAPWIDLDGESVVDAWAFWTSWRRKMVVLRNPVALRPGDTLMLEVSADLRVFPPVYKFDPRVSRGQGVACIEALGEVVVTHDLFMADWGHRPCAKAAHTSP
mmetsp:Transcript_11347/g.30327  ORF Transcript_11347/g.30327 Transcript_11347/m.30327 type:complete len:335 (-) Transcript_11347:80-1084(-)